MEPILSFDWDCRRRPSEAVIESVAELEGTDPIDLDPLSHAIDPAAMDRLFDPATAAGQPPQASIEFRYLGYHVSVRANGEGDIFDGQHASPATEEPARPIASRGP